MSWSTVQGRIKHLVGLIEEGEEDKKLGREASRRLGFSPATINGLLGGRTLPSFTILERMHVVTGVNLNWLICNSGRPEDGAPHGRVIWPETTHESILKRTAKRTKKPPVDARRTGTSKKQT